MVTDIAASWATVTVTQVTRRIVMDNTVKQEVLGLRGGHLIELSPEHASSSRRILERFSNIQVGDQVEVKGNLLIEQEDKGVLKMSIAIQRMRIVKPIIAQKDSVEGFKSDTDQEVPVHIMSKV
ncbi:hypothetical protein BGX24_012260 [Mortierella sp. AD032]|nr:hypothetical protein BGX24_012260 [Mortierella sp. AD032]